MKHAPTNLLLSALSLPILLACRVEDRVGSPERTGAAVTEAGTLRATALATFAGGCFWCMEKPFEVLPGVAAVISGYTGGHVDEPTYEQVCAGITGHAEAIQVHYDPRRVSYADLLEVFWRQIDPTDAGGQFVDRGSQYRSAIFVHDESQREIAERSRAALATSGRFDAPIVTEIVPFERYWEAEDYHQDYYRTHPENYHRYRNGSGRDDFLDAVWGPERHYEPTPPEPPANRWADFEKPPIEELRATLTPLQFRVTQQDGTELPFDNRYWDEHRAGIFVDVVSGEPLFSSKDKFDSGTGWPSFTRPLVEEHIRTGVDHKLGYPRDELRSRYADSHLGHVFDDGPPPTGQRYCINSAALRFVPVEELEAEGYGEFLGLFDSQAPAH